MKITVKVPASIQMQVAQSADDSMHIDIEVDPAGETLCKTIMNATGGQLDAYKSRFTQNGNIRLHLFGDGRKIFVGLSGETDCLYVTWTDTEENARSQFGDAVTAEGRSGSDGDEFQIACISDLYITFDRAQKLMGAR
jgi:hypothetical protein